MGFIFVTFNFLPYSSYRWQCMEWYTMFHWRVLKPSWPMHKPLFFQWFSSTVKAVEENVSREMLAVMRWIDLLRWRWQKTGASFQTLPLEQIQSGCHRMSVLGYEPMPVSISCGEHSTLSSPEGGGIQLNVCSNPQAKKRRNNKEAQQTKNIQ